MFSTSAPSFFLAILLVAPQRVGCQVPTNDTCENPAPVILDAGPVQGSTLFAGDHATASCSVFPGGRDVVYRLVLDETTSLSIHTVGSKFDTVLSVWKGCTGTGLSEEIACNDDFEGITSRIDFPGLPPGEYFVLVDGIDSLNAGDYTLNVVSPGTPDNDTCEQAQNLSVGTAVLGSTLGANNSAVIPGKPSAGPDVFYKFEATSQRIRVDTLGSEIDTVLQVREGSCSGTVVGVNDDAEGTPQSQIDLEGLTIGETYYVQVDAPEGEAGTFRLTLTEREDPPPNDTCSLSLPAVSYPYEATGTTRFATNSDSTGAGPDVVFRISLPETTSLVLDTHGSRFDTVLYVREGDCTGPLVGISDDFLGGKTSQLALSSLQPGNYFVFVDGATVWDRGDFVLHLAAAAPPINDDCTDALEITLPGTQVGSTLFATNSTDATDTDCLSEGNEVVFRLTLDRPTRLTLDTEGSEFDTVLYLRSGSCGTPSLAACDDDSLGILSRIDDFSETPLPAGEYRVYVDGKFPDEAGTFVLNIRTFGDAGTPGDFDGNGAVDSKDLLVLVGEWGLTSASQELTADLDGDDEVESDDLFLFQPEWKKETSP